MEKQTGEDTASGAAAPHHPIRANIQHNTVRAKAPMSQQMEAHLRRAAAEAEKPQVQLSREQVAHAYDILEERRVGPYMVKYGAIGSVGIIAYTYIRGLIHLAQKNRDAWVGTFRHRIFIMGPIIAMYATANDVIPLPYKEWIEASLGRKAVSMYDIVTAEATIKKAQSLPLSAQV